jgi:protein FAM50
LKYRDVSSQSKKKRKNAVRGKLSFADDEDESSGVSSSNTPRLGTPKTKTEDEGDDVPATRKLGPNAKVAYAPKALTKAALVKEAQTREQLRKEFIRLQASVKATEIIIPFVFYDGTNIPGGMCRVKKGDHVWFFLDKARKVGAERGVGSDLSRKGWARTSIDDLMLVRGGIILPPVSCHLS